MASYRPCPVRLHANRARDQRAGQRNVLAETKSLVREWHCCSKFINVGNITQLRNLHNIAESSGGSLIRLMEPLHEHWHVMPTTTLFELECSRGHHFGGSIDILEKGGWCPVCQQFQERAKQALARADTPTALRDAIAEAAAAGVCASVIAVAESRLSELITELAHQERLAELGAGEVPYPSEFLCPINHDRMTDPVVASDGHTYELESIKQVIETTGISPLTREPLLDIVIPNLALRSRMRSFYAEAVAIGEAVAREAGRERVHVFRSIRSGLASLGEDVARARARAEAVATTELTQSPATGAGAPARTTRKRSAAASVQVGQGEPRQRARRR